MKIPNNKITGGPTMSASQLRTYGAGGFRLDEQEEAKGCPRLYKAKYVERRVVEERSEILAYGSFMHDVLFRLENEDLTPEEALEQCFPVDLDPSYWVEARKDLTAYMERGASPVDRYATIAVEAHLTALLYVDEEFGPIYWQAYIDWLGLDPDVGNTLHVVDYKTNRMPPSLADVMGDAQMKAYHWVVAQNASKFGMTNPRIVVHLDAIKWREVEVTFTNQDIEDWHSWAVAVCRKILRDETAEPRTNPGCAWCPVKADCPAFDALPAQAADLAAALVGIEDPKDRLAWRDAANGIRLLLEKSVKAIDLDFDKATRAAGRIVVGETEFVLEPDWKTEIDIRSLHRAMGGEFYDVVTASKKAIETKTADWDTASVAPVKQAISRVPAGTKVVKRKVGKQ